MTTLGRHPDRLLVKFTLGDGATLIATNADGWAGPVTLGYGGPTGEPVIVDTATVVGTTATWTLTEAQVTDRAAHDWARLEDNGLTVAAGRVIDVAGWQGATQSQTIAAVQSGPPGPTVISSDPGNVATLGSDGFIFVEPGAGTVTSVNGETGVVVLDAADVGAAEAVHSHDYAATGHTHPAPDLSALVVTTDPRLSDARTPTAHTHDDRYYTETETDSLLSGKADTAALHSHANKAALDLVSGTNTGDQDLTPYATTASLAAVATSGEAADLDATAATDGHVLTADGAGGVAWEAPPAGGGGVWTLIGSYPFTGSAITLDSLPQTYATLRLDLVVYNTIGGGQALSMICNNDTGTNYATNGNGGGQSSIPLLVCNIGAAVSAITIRDYAITRPIAQLPVQTFSTGSINAGNSNFAYLAAFGGRWNDDEPLTSVTITPASSGLTGTINLYGIN